MSFLFGKIRKSEYLSIGVLLVVAALFVGCSSSSSDPVPMVPDITVDLSGTVEDGNDQAIEGVTVNAFLASNDSSAEDTETTGANGAYTVTVIEGGNVYLELQHPNYVTLNSRIASFDMDETGVDFDMFTEIEAETVIDTAFGAGLGLVLANHAWLAANVINATTRAELNVQVVSITPTPQSEGPTDCNGVIVSNSNATVAPCPMREGPMYIAYFDSDNEVTISAGGVSVDAPVRMGEVTVVNIEVP